MQRLIGHAPDARKIEGMARAALARLPRLTTVEMVGCCHVTPAAVRKLRAKKPLLRSVRGPWQEQDGGGGGWLGGLHAPPLPTVHRL